MSPACSWEHLRKPLLGVASPELARSLAGVKGGPDVTDGEVCVLDDIGRSDFKRLRMRATRRRWHEGVDPVPIARSTC